MSLFERIITIGLSSQSITNDIWREVEKQKDEKSISLIISMSQQPRHWNACWLIERGYLSALRILINNKKIRLGPDAMIIAAKHGHMDIIRYLYHECNVDILSHSYKYMAGHGMSEREYFTYIFDTKN